MSKEKDLSPKLFPSPSRWAELWGFCFVRTRRSWRDFCSSECEEVRRVLPSCSVRVLPLRPFGDGRRRWQVCNFFKLPRHTHKKNKKTREREKKVQVLLRPRNRRCIKSTKKVNEIKKTERKEEKRRKREEKKKRKEKITTTAKALRGGPRRAYLLV